MDLFDIADPAKVAEAKRREDLQRRIDHPDLWPTCIDCNTKTNPLAIGEESAAGAVCLTCCMKRRKNHYGKV